MDFSRITNYLPQIHNPLFIRGRIMLGSCCGRLYSKLLDIRDLARIYLPKAYSGAGTCMSKAYRVVRTPTAKAYNVSRPIILANKERILWGVASSVLAAVAIRYYRNRPQYPIASLRSSLNIAKLSIETLKREVAPPNVSLTFCVDISGSMKGEREGAVKGGVEAVLDSALKVVNATEGAQIEVAIVGFNDKAGVICNPTVIDVSKMDQIKDSLKGYQSSGSTKILEGLNLATVKLEEIAARNKNRVNTLILLSDGGESLDQGNITPFHERLARVNAQLFAIGIGNGHNKKTLQQIAPSEGAYIDTTEEGETIEKALSAIYEQAVAVFSELVLSSKQLSPGTWSVDRVASVDDNGESTCQLGSFTEERGVVKTIEIHRDGFGEKFDLFTIVFDLSFKDPRGRKGTMSLHWNSNTCMDPEVLR